MKAFPLVRIQAGLPNMKSKLCNTCNQVLPSSAFGKNRSKRDGLQSNCRKCRSREMRDRRKRLGKKELDAIRAGQKARRKRNRRFLCKILSKAECVDCGESDPVVLDFDHVRGNKTDAVTTMAAATASIKKLKKEIRKCEIVCANCHRRRESVRNKKHWIHWYEIDKPS